MQPEARSITSSAELAVALDLRRLEALPDLVAMQPRQPALVVDIAADVTRQVAGRQPRLGQRAGADRQPVQQLDMHEALAPRLLDQPPRHEAADGEVRVQTVAARMPLRHPHIREPAPAKARPQLAEEPGQVAA